MVFVGREGELARAAAALERARGGESTRVVLTGPAGIGSSRLLDELETRLAGLADVSIARGRSYEPLGGVPYTPLVEALTGVLAPLTDETLRAVATDGGLDLADLLPSLEGRLRGLGTIPATPLRSPPEHRASRIAETVLGVLQRLAGDGLVVLVLEDLHHADPATLGFVETLLRVSRPLRLCLVVTYRPEELHRRHPMSALAATLAEDPRTERVEISPLGRRELVELLQGLTGERPSGTFLAAVSEGSRGNPLLAEEIVAAGRGGAGLRLSAPFEEIVEARLAGLSQGAVRCLRVLAAARRPLANTRLLGVDAGGGRLVAAHLEEAMSAGLVRRVPVPGASDLVAVRHERHAEAIAALALPADRQEAHAALARVAELAAGERAWHWESATRFAAARNAHAEAGESAEPLDPGPTALLHYARALELLETQAEDVLPLAITVPRLLARAADAAAVGGSFRRAAQLAQQAIHARSTSGVLAAVSRRGEGARRGLQLEVAEYYERLGRFRWAAGDSVPALAAFESAVQLVPIEPIPQRARALASLAQHFMLDGRFAESAELCRQAIDVANAAGPEATAEAGHATCTLAVDQAYLGDVGRGLSLLADATALSRGAGRLDDVMRAYANRTTLLDLELRREEAIATVHEGIGEARRWGQEQTYGAFLRGNAADCLFDLGRWGEMEEECRTALEWVTPRTVWNPTLALALVLVESRADEEAMRFVGRTLLQLEAVPHGQWSAALHRTAVSFALWREDLADARRVAERGWERVRATEDWAQAADAAATTAEACATVAEAARARHDMGTVASATELAGRAIADAEALVARDGMPASVGARREAELYLATARAHLARARNRGTPDLWARNAEAWERIPVPYLAAKARRWEGAAALAARDQSTRGRARDALSEAWRLAAPLPARPLLRAVADLARRGRVALPVSASEEAALLGAPPASAPLEFPRPLEKSRGRDAAPATGAGAGRAAGAAPATAAGEHGAGSISERLAPAPGQGGDPFGLSPREHEVLRVLVEGRTNREIAERLFISERTVDVHVRNILGKLGVAGRVEATSVALRLGLVGGLSGAGRG